MHMNTSEDFRVFMVERKPFIEKLIKIHEENTGEVLTFSEAQEMFELLVRLTSVVLEYE